MGAITRSPPLPWVDVDLAMGAAGADTTMKPINVGLMDDHLEEFPYTYALSSGTVHYIKENTFFAVGLLLACVLIGKTFLASGMLIHEVSVLYGILDAIRLVRCKRGSPQDTSRQKQTTSYVA